MKQFLSMAIICLFAFTANAQLAINSAVTAFPGAKTGFLNTGKPAVELGVSYPIGLTDALKVEPEVAVRIRPSHSPEYRIGARLTTGGDQFRLYGKGALSLSGENLKPIQLPKTVLHGGFGGEWWATSKVAAFAEVMASTMTNTRNFSLSPSVSIGVRYSPRRYYKAVSKTAVSISFPAPAPVQMSPEEIRTQLYRDTTFINELKAAIQQNLYIVGNTVWTLDSIRQKELGEKIDSLNRSWKSRFANLQSQVTAGDKNSDKITAYFSYGSYELERTQGTRVLQQTEQALNKWGYSLVSKQGYQLFSERSGLEIIITGIASNETKSKTFSNETLANNRAKTVFEAIVAPIVATKPKNISYVSRVSPYMGDYIALIEVKRK